jgi:hypothetical protein
MPKITLQKGIPEYFVSQSPSEIMPRLPGANALIVGPSRAGKSTAMASMILDKDKYRGVFSRIFLWTPSIDVDDSWEPVKRYIREELGHDEKAEGPFCFSTFNPADMLRIAKRQQKITETLKKAYAEKNYTGQKRLYQLLFIIDDFADSPQVLRKAGGVIESCFIRYRHFGISTWLSVQAPRLVSPAVRKNITFCLLFAVRSAQELMIALLEEFSNLVSKEGLLKLYRLATERPYQFLFINFMARSPQEGMFYRSFESMLVPQERERLEDER